MVTFFRSTFDIDNIDIGPERRHYLDHRLSRVWEMNSEVRTGLVEVEVAWLSSRLRSYCLKICV